MSKTRIKKPVAQLASRADAEQAVDDIALFANTRRGMTAMMDKEILAVKTKYERDLDVLSLAIDQKTDALEQWSSANPQLFEKKKSIAFLAGTIGFRTGTPKLVLLRGWNWKKVLDAVCVHLPKFTRTVPEIDKEGIIAQREELAGALPLIGCKVDQGESFYVAPNLTDAEVQS